MQTYKVLKNFHVLLRDAVSGAGGEIFTVNLYKFFS